MVLKNETQGNYLIVSQTIMHDKSLKLFDRGLLVTLMSLPDNWDFTINGLAKIICDGRDAISSGLKRLEERGYLVNEQLRVDGKFSGKCLRINVSPDLKESGEVAADTASPEENTSEEPILESPVPDRTASEETVTENPMPDDPLPGNPLPKITSTEMPSTGKPLSGIPAQLNNKEFIIQKSNIQESNNNGSNIQGYVIPVGKGEKHGTDNGTGNGADTERPVRHTKAGVSGWTKDEIDLYGL